MKYLIVLLAAGLIPITFTSQAEAQILKRLKKKAQQAVEQEAEKKLAEQMQLAAQKMVENSWNAIFGEMAPDSATGKLPFTMNSNVKTEDVYNFDTIVSMEVETIKKKGKSDPPVAMDMYYNANEMYTGTRFSSEEMKTKDGDLFIIYDFKNSAMLMLMANEKDKFSFAYDWTQALDQVADSVGEQPEEINWDEVNEWEGYSKIGQKEILGYNCDGYRSENPDGTIELWVSRDTSFGMDFALFKANANAKQMKGKIPENYPYGMIMEMTSEDLKSGDKTMMKVTDIQTDAKVKYAMADYPTMSFAANSTEN